MIDLLFERSRLAIAESRLLTQRHKMLREELEIRRGRLRLTMLENAMDRSERKAVFNDKR
jgi:hypothetical protein